MRPLVKIAMAWLAIAPAAFAAEPIQIGEYETLHSKILDEERTLIVRLPAGYAASEVEYPVLYLLDSRTRFHHTTGTVSALARTGHVPDMIVVGIVNTQRTRDLTPPWTNEERSDEIPGLEQLIETGGGADQFLRFLREELVPHIEGKYRAASFRILVGHSFGGLFAVHAFAHDPDLFSATLAISPSLWWDLGKSVEQTQQLLEKQPELGGRFYLTLADEGGDMVVQFRNMQTLLRYRAPESLSWHAEVLDGEDHGSIPMTSVYRALRFFYPRWQVPPFVQEDGLEGLDAHYASLSEDYGYRIETPEATINNLGYQALGSEDVEGAVEIFRANAERYPSSANVYDSLGEAVEAAGRLEEARDLFRRAVENGEKREDPNLSVYRDHLAAVEEKIASGS